jgi:hypothetical protein
MSQILEAFRTLSQQNAELRETLSTLRSQTPVSHVSRPKDPRLPDVETYDGKNVLKAREFILHLDIYFNGQPSTYGTDQAKLSYASSRLRGTAFSWVTPFLLLHENSQDHESSSNLNVQSYAAFRSEFLRTFGEQDRIVNAEAKLRSLKQGNRSAALLAAELRTNSVDVDWNESALISAYYAGLNEDVKDKLCTLDLPSNLNDYLALVIKIDNRLFQRKREMQRGTSTKTSSQPTSKSTNQRASSSTTTVSHSTNDGPQPMVLDAATKKLTTTERNRRIQEKLCLYCGNSGHAVANCPNSKRQVAAPATITPITTSSSGKDNAQA